MSNSNKIYRHKHTSSGVTYNHKAKMFEFYRCFNSSTTDIHEYFNTKEEAEERAKR